MLKLRTIFFGCLIVFAFIFAWQIWQILAGLFLALVISTLVDGAAEMFKKIKIPRVVSVVFVYLAIIVLFYFAFYFLIPPIIDEIKQFSENVPDYIENFSPQLEQLRVFWSQYKASDTLQKSLFALGEKMVSMTSSITSFISMIFGGAITALVVFFISLLLSLEEKGVEKFLGIFVPVQSQQNFARLLCLSQKKIRGWFLGRFFSAIVVGFLIYAGLFLMGVKYKITLAIIAALFEFVPIIGSWFAAIIGIILTAFQSLKFGLFSSIMYLAVQQLESNIFSPFFMKRTAGINPVLSIIALMVGAELGGVLGVLIAIPFAVVVLEIINDLKRGQASEVQG